MIIIDNLVKSFDGFPAVNSISFKIKPGEVLGFLGPNGAGKSTTMKMITGFIRPDSGAVSIFDLELAKHPVEAKSIMGYLPEGGPAYGDMTVKHYLEFIADIRGLQGEYKDERLATVCDQLELSEVWHRHIETLSKGFKRRVGIAQAIIHDPKVLILDEPTDGLDPNQKHHVRELIQQLAEDKIVIISTHILEEVAAVCTRAIIIANGKVLADATPTELEGRSRYHGSLTIASSDEIATSLIETELHQLPEVEDVEIYQDQDGCRFTIIPKSEAELFQSVTTLFQNKNWPVTEFFIERGRLDDVFRTLTHDSDNDLQSTMGNGR